MLIGRTDNDERRGSDGRKVLHRISLVPTSRFADVRRQDARARSCSCGHRRDTVPAVEELLDEQASVLSVSSCRKSRENNGLGCRSPSITQEKGTICCISHC